jgi:hypothetical protein
MKEEKYFPPNSGQKTCIYFSATELGCAVLLCCQTNKEVPMLSKCANPSCSTPLVYLREGKIFMMETAAQPPIAAKTSATSPKVANRVEHFWLCGPCSAQMTLFYDLQNGVQVVPKKFQVLAAAS